MERFDHYWVGILIGLILPAAFGITYLYHFNLMLSWQMFGMALSETWSKLILVSVFPNLAFIFVFYAADMWKASKGMLISSFPYLIASLAIVL